MAAMEQMPLMKSVVYECLRIKPPVPLQYGRAKKDLLIESHDVVFEVKEGEMLFGFQPFATKDPEIFERAEEFFGERFMDEEGEKLLKHVIWSNGPETQTPTLRRRSMNLQEEKEKEEEKYEFWVTRRRRRWPTIVTVAAVDLQRKRERENGRGGEREGEDRRTMGGRERKGEGVFL